MADITDVAIDAALARGAVTRQNEPRASAVRYDAATRRIIISFASGAEMIVPVHLLEGLAGATDDQIAEVELLGAGYGLHWETLDVDLTVPGIVMGVFGTAKWMAKIAGQTKSEKKAAAARANGALGGRPRKTAAKGVHEGLKTSNETFGSPTGEADFERSFLRNIHKADGSAARSMLQAGRPVHIRRSDTPPGHVIRIHPGGREELVLVDADYAKRQLSTR